jgi:hypothetical protein
MRIEESSPSHRPLPEGAAFAVWVIYERPKDFPQGYVLRCQWPMKDGTIQIDRLAWYADSAEKLREIVPPGLFCLRHQPGDPPHVVESWF